MTELHGAIFELACCLIELETFFMQTITMTSKKNLLSLSYWSKNTVVCNLILSCTSIDTCQLIAVFFFFFFFFGTSKLHF